MSFDGSRSEPPSVGRGDGSRDSILTVSVQTGEGPAHRIRGTRGQRGTYFVTVFEQSHQRSVTVSSFRDYFRERPETHTFWLLSRRQGLFSPDPEPRGVRGIPRQCYEDWIG